MSPPASFKCGCQFCGNHIEFPPELSGFVATCPHCQQATLLAAEAAPTVSATPSVADGIPEVRVPPQPVSTAYQFGLVLAAGMMVLMPLVYLATVGFVGWCVWQFAGHGWSFLGAGVPRRAGLAYVLPLLAGVAVLLFMIAPFFRRRIAPPQALALNPAAEPVLFEFIQRVCHVVGAPMPARIDLDCQLNAGAGYRRSAAGRDFVLTIGLPLVAGLNLRQFAGVLAHEFGHFTQTSGMRLSHFIRGIHGWFAELLCDGNAWEETEEEGQADLFVLLVRLLVGLTRIPLRITLFAGRAASSFLMRQMEFDADRYEMEVAGSRAFEETMRRLRVLRRAVQRSYESLRMTWQQRRGIPDNFPALVLQQEAMLSGTLRAKLERGAEEEREWFATHPSDAERVQRARARNSPGLVVEAGPAAALFGNFEVIARQVTLLHYTEDLEIPLVSGALVPVSSMPGAPGRGGTA